VKPFLLPDLGEGLQEARVVQWHVAEGDSVTADQVVVSVETAKSLIDITAPCSAIITSLCAQVDETVSVSENLYLYQSGASQVLPAQDDATSHSDTTTADFIPSMPKARALAAEYGYNLHDIAKHSQRDWITVDCVEDFHQSRQSHASQQSSSPLYEITQNAWREAVQTVVMDEFSIESWYGEDNVTWVVVQALRQVKKSYPKLFCRVEDARTLQDDPCLHIAFPAYRQGFTQLAVIRDCHLLSKEAFLSSLQELKNNPAPQSDSLADAHTIISNVGAFGGRYATPLCMPPLLSTFALGRAQPRPHVQDNTLCVAHLLPISLCTDHRFVDGADMVAALSLMGQFLTDYRV
jgi:pyruvate dehydrogenase E2 component (dihydrolipoamide acetyltransferase)